MNGGSLLPALPRTPWLRALQRERLGALEAARRDLPARIGRHSLAARLFHWIMAASMFVLLFTAFLPIAGVQFAWVTWHWMAGIVLTASILFHVIHATFWMDFWSIWVGPRDLPELKAELLREMGHEVEGPKPGKYPLGNRLYHTAIVLAGLAVVASGLFMMVRVRTPFFTRNPYVLSDAAWGFTYVVHGLAGVSLVGLVMAHVYFAVRPGDTTQRPCSAAPSRRSWGIAPATWRRRSTL